MENQVWIGDAIGKQIKDVTTLYNEQFITYTDGTFSYLRIDFSGDLEDEYAFDYDKLINKLQIINNGEIYFDSTYHTMIQLGILDEHKIKEDLQEKINRIKADIEEKEREQYEKLRVKFENKQIY